MLIGIEKMKMNMIKLGLLGGMSGALLLMAGCASEPQVPQAMTDPAPSLVGSKWRYSDDQWQYDIIFSANGVLKSTHPNDKTKNNDTWEQDGANVSLYYNNKYSQYKGVLSGANVMSGTAVNKTGTTWNWKATRAD
jgi:outer membrane biogenesis lipoprotein LolB